MKHMNRLITLVACSFMVTSYASGNTAPTEAQLKKSIRENKIDQLKQQIVKLKQADAEKSGALISSLLFEAIRQGETECLLRLIDSGANLNIRGDRGHTPLFATMSREYKIPSRVRLMLAATLLDRGADVNAVDQKGRTALQYVCSLTDDIYAARLLTGSKAVLDTRSNDGMTPFLAAVKQRNYRIVNHLIALGVDTTTSDTQTLTPALIVAVKNSDKQMYQLLLKHGAFIDARDGNSLTALMWATLRGDLATVKELMRLGAAVNRRTLHYIEQRVVMHADARDVEIGFMTTACQMARMLGHTQIVKFLEAQGGR
jgi:uncharacterized protein